MGHTGRAIPDHQPLVAHLERASALLGIEPEALEAAVSTTGLEAWGRHASGAPVYAWDRLLEAAAAAGLPIPDRKAHAWRRRPAIRTKAGPS